MKKICLFVLVVIISSCKPKTNDDIDLFSTYNRQEMLSDLGNHVIIPTFAEASLQMDSLHAALQAFQINPSQNTLLEARNRWKKAFFAWLPASVYQFGMLYDGGAGLLATLDNWAGNPKTMEAAVSTTAIENHISGTASLDSLFWQNLPVNQKGFPAMEYLLFGDSSQSFQNPRRQAYITLLSYHQARLLKQIHQSWIHLGAIISQTLPLLTAEMQVLL
jgi:predicted lipoprotein